MFAAKFTCLIVVLINQACGGQLTEETGNVTSPGYPDDYPGNANCTWTIRAPESYLILLHFNIFQLEYDSYCNKDYLEIYDDSSINSDKRIVRYYHDYIKYHLLFYKLR